MKTKEVPEGLSEKSSLRKIESLVAELQMVSYPIWLTMGILPQFRMMLLVILQNIEKKAKIITIFFFQPKDQNVGC